MDESVCIVCSKKGDNKFFSRAVRTLGEEEVKKNLCCSQECARSAFIGWAMPEV